MAKHFILAAVLGAASLFSAAPVLAAPVVGAPAATGQRVLVIPFSALNVPDHQQWISKGVVESIVADLGRLPGTTPIAFQGQLVVEDNATAVRLARQAGAPLVIRGAAQFVGTNVRLTAQMIDVRTGDTINTATVTGPADDLLKMEDDLSAQLRGQGGPVIAGNSPATSAPAVVGTTPVTPAYPQTVYPPANGQPQVIFITQPAAPTYTPGYDTYGYPGYANYGGFYGYGYSPIFTTVIYGNRNCFPFCNTFRPTWNTGFGGRGAIACPPGGVRAGPVPVSGPRSFGPVGGFGGGGRTSFISARGR